MRIGLSRRSKIWPRAGRLSWRSFAAMGVLGQWADCKVQQAVRQYRWCSTTSGGMKKIITSQSQKTTRPANGPGRD